MSPNALSPADALANVFSERKHRAKLGLSRYVAEASEELAEHENKLSVTRLAKDIADVHSTLWPVEQKQETILNLGVLIGTNPPRKINTEQA